MRYPRISFCLWNIIAVLFVTIYNILTIIWYLICWLVIFLLTFKSYKFYSARMIYVIKTSKHRLFNKAQGRIIKRKLSLKSYLIRNYYSVCIINKGNQAVWYWYILAIILGAICGFIK